MTLEELRTLAVVGRARDVESPKCCAYVWTVGGFVFHGKTPREGDGHLYDVRLTDNYQVGNLMYKLAGKEREKVEGAQ